MTDNIEAYLYICKNKTIRSYNGYVRKRMAMQFETTSFRILSEGRSISVSKLPCMVYKDTLWMEKDDIQRAKELFVKHYTHRTSELIERMSKIFTRKDA